MHEIQSDSKIVVEANETGKLYLSLLLPLKSHPRKGFFRRIFNKIRPPRVIPMEQIPRITAEVTGAPDDLAKISKVNYLHLPKNHLKILMQRYRNLGA